MVDLWQHDLLSIESHPRPSSENFECNASRPTYPNALEPSAYPGWQKITILSLTLHECLNFFVILSRSSSARFCCSDLSYTPKRARCSFFGSEYCNALWKIFLTASWRCHRLEIWEVKEILTEKIKAKKRTLCYLWWTSMFIF